MKPIVEFKSISKRFAGIQALKSVTFSILPGEIHAIIGENGAGKSTLMNILAGIYEPDDGELIYQGEKTVFSSPLESKAAGIATVFQELKLCPNLNVLENIFLGREIKQRGVFLDWNKMRVQAKEKISLLGLNIDLKSTVGDLSIAQKQLVEIAKAMFIDANLLILDEPTSSLSAKESDKLFKIVRNLKAKGVTVIFISHRMEEIFMLSDRISVMNNGSYIGTYITKETDPATIVNLITKDPVSNNYKLDTALKRLDFSGKEVALEVENLNRGKLVKNVNFKLYKGEILGFYGLEGAGRTELMETLFQLHHQDSGSIKLFQQEITWHTVRSSLSHGIAMVPENRKVSGLFMNFSIADNIISNHDKDITTFGVFIKQKEKTNLANSYSQKLSIKSRDIYQNVKELSGGNQQKIVLAKCLSTNPSIIIMDEPTRGIDIGAKIEIYQLLQNLRNKEGKTIIFVSSEIDEIATQCDRVLVMRNNTIVGELHGDQITNGAILQLAFNG